MIKRAFLAAATAAAILATPPALAMAPEPVGPTAQETLVQVERLLAAEDYGKAIELLESAIESNDKNPDLWSQLGFAKRKIGQYEQSETYYNMALHLEPEHQAALEYIGELFLETGRPWLADEALARLVALCPDGCKARTELEKAIEAAASS